MLSVCCEKCVASCTELGIDANPASARAADEHSTIREARKEERRNVVSSLDDVINGSVLATLAADDVCEDCSGHGVVDTLAADGVSEDLATRVGVMSHLTPADGISERLSDTILDTNIPAELLRGVGLDTVLRHVGKVFSSSTGTQTDHSKSFPIERLEDFISHDWRAKRSSKFVALCLMYNSTMACGVAFAAGLVLALLQSDSAFGVLPYPTAASDANAPWGCWCQCLCPLVFACVLVFWQSWRAMLRLATSKVFLDKLCIDQVDSQRKVAAILCLAGFLKSTDRLVILWTPRYFTRLWCVYEIASWLYLGKPLAKVHFMPLALAFWIVVQISATALMCLTVAVSQYTVSQSDLAMGMVILVFAPLYARVLRHMIRDLRALPQQVSQFSMATATCFCCSVGHTMPGTSEEITCDRKVVCRTISTWFPSRGSDMHGTLTAPPDIPHFDQKIRELFGPSILHRCGPMQIRYEYCLLISQPYLWRMLDVTASFATWPAPANVKIGNVVSYLVICFFVSPITIKVSFWWFCWIDRLTCIFRCVVLDVLFSALLCIPVLAVYSSLIFPLNLWLDSERWFRLYGYCIALMIATLLVFTDVARNSLCHKRCRRVHREPKVAYHAPSSQYM